MELLGGKIDNNVIADVGSLICPPDIFLPKAYTEKSGVKKLVSDQTLGSSKVGKFGP